MADRSAGVTAEGVGGGIVDAKDQTGVVDLYRIGRCGAGWTDRAERAIAIDEDLRGAIAGDVADNRAEVVFFATGVTKMALDGAISRTWPWA